MAGSLRGPEVLAAIQAGPDTHLPLDRPIRPEQYHRSPLADLSYPVIGPGAR